MREIESSDAVGIDWDEIDVEKLHALVFDEDERRRYWLPPSIRHRRIREREAFGDEVKSRDLVRARQRSDFHTGLIRFFRQRGTFLMLTIALPHHRAKAIEETRAEYSRLARELRDHLPVRKWGGFYITYPECTASLRSGVHRHVHVLAFVPDGVDLEAARLQLDDGARDAVENVLKRDVYWHDPAVMVTNFDADNAAYFFKDSNVHGDGNGNSMGEADLEREIHRRKSRGLSSRAHGQLLADMRAVMKGVRVSAPKSAGDLANSFAALHRRESRLVVSAEGRTTRMIRGLIRELKPRASSLGGHRLGPSVRMVRTDPLGNHDEVSGWAIRRGSRAPTTVMDNVVDFRSDGLLAERKSSVTVDLTISSDPSRRTSAWDIEVMDMESGNRDDLLNGLMDTKIGKAPGSANCDLRKEGAADVDGSWRHSGVIEVDFTTRRWRDCSESREPISDSLAQTGLGRPVIVPLIA